MKLKNNSFSLLSVIGALIGKQKGRNIEVMNSFELMFSVIEGDIIIDRDYYNLKEEQCEYFFFRKVEIKIKKV